MYKQIVLTITTVWLVVGVGCKKAADPTESNGSLLVNQSRAFFENEVLSVTPDALDGVSAIHANDDPGKWRSKTPVWEKATVISLSTGAAVMVPVQFKEPWLIQNNLSGKTVYSSNDVIKLLIYKDRKGQFHAEKLVFFPDSNYFNVKGHAFTGIINVETWWGGLLNRFKFEANGEIKKYKPGSSITSPIPGSGTSDRWVIVVCYESSGYNYAADDPNHGYYWTSELGCHSYFLADPNNSANDHMATAADYGATGAGGTPGGMGATKAFSVVNGNDPVTNIWEYMKCFTNSPGYGNTYTVTLCVKQPIPGSRETWGLSGEGSSASGNPVAVGHAFLILNQTNALGSTVRNVGFYPEDGVTPMSPRSNGKINNDATHDYNISVAISMDNSQFFRVVNYLNLWTESSTTYDLNTNNCTNFALNALANAGINLPRTTGTWLNGGGLNPGDLGEDIRRMQLPSNMTRTIMTGTHPNMGYCY